MDGPRAAVPFPRIRTNDRPENDIFARVAGGSERHDREGPQCGHRAVLGMPREQARDRGIPFRDAPFRDVPRGASR
jgi:hypothetical protein